MRMEWDLGQMMAMKTNGTCNQKWNVNECKHILDQ